MKNKTFFITTPIFYPTGKPHLGHTYTMTLAWVIKNYKQLMGYDAKLLTGVDENGEKIQQKALEMNLPTQSYVDKMSKIFQAFWKKMELNYDFYSRTTKKDHQQIVQKIFATLLKQKIIYKGIYSGLYSIEDEEHVTKTQAIKKNNHYYHPSSKHKLKLIKEETYFLKVKLFQKWLLKQFQKSNWIIPRKIINELKKNFLTKLEDLSITRTSFDWGIKVNSRSKHIIYVWFDALTNYITSLGYKSKDNQNYLKYWLKGSEKVHILGKEIARFHCIYWPIILKALKIPLPTKILCHGWIITKEGKMSKSKKNAFDPSQLLKMFDVEVIKYYLVSQIDINLDSGFEFTRIKDIYNSDLVNNFGNLVSRTSKMITTNFKQAIKYQESQLLIDKKIEKQIVTIKGRVINLFDSYKLDKAFKLLMSFSKSLNKYISLTKPWKLLDESQRLTKILNNLLNGIYLIATFLSVVMPKKMTKLAKQLNINKFSLEKITNLTKFDKIVINANEILFLRMK